MPGWNTHLTAGMMVNDVIKYTGADKEKFLLGNILPDINNGWLVTDVHKKIVHDTTHVCAENEFAWKHFYDKYKKVIQNKEPICVGYLLHLFLDAHFNDDFYEAIKGTSLDALEKDEKRILKQQDFSKFDAELNKIKFVMNNIGEDVEATKRIDEVEIDAEDLRKTNEFLAREVRKVNKGYNFYNEARLREILYGTVEDFIWRVIQTGGNDA